MKTDLRDRIAQIEASGEIKTLRGADWNKEIGTLVELNAKARGPALLFDEISDYPPGFRLLAGAMSSAKRLAGQVERVTVSGKPRSFLSGMLFLKKPIRRDLMAEAKAARVG